MDTLFDDNIQTLRQALTDIDTKIKGLDNPMEFSNVTDSIKTLVIALDAQFDISKKRGRPRRRYEETLEDKRNLQQKLRRQTELTKQAEESLVNERGSRLSCRIQSVWMIRAALAPPNIPVRKLSGMFRDFSVVETNQMSHSYISKARDAFVEIIKGMNRKQLSHALSASLPAGEPAQESMPVFIKHVHDEASMKVKSYNDPTLLGEHADVFSNPGWRGKSSKVQNHVLTAHIGQTSVEAFAELQALQNKDATTIAHSLITTLQQIIASLSAGIQPEHRDVTTLRMIHLLTGDAVPTNEAAAKRVWKYFRHHARRLGLRYSLLVIKCSSHQSNLVVQVAICGKVLKKAVEVDALCGTCSRLFKYLMADYLEDFATALKRQVLAKFSILEEDEGSADTIMHRQHSKRMQELYGKDVLPDELLALFNKRLHEFETVAPPGTNKKDLYGRVYRTLYRWLFIANEKPIVTRFWLFSSCVWTLLRFTLLGLDLSAVFVTQTKTPTKDNKRRLNAVLKYFGDEHHQTGLRTASLCLRLTSYVTSLTGQTKEGAHELPLFVRLSQGVVQAKSSNLLQSILPRLFVDDKIDATHAVLGLFTTQGHIIMRFELYLRYPYLLWRLTREFNAAGYTTCILEFLETDDELLDVGYSLQLKCEALATGSLAAACSYLMSDKIQKELSGICWKAACNSLDAERKIAQEKKNETVKTTGLPRASRNGILQRYRLQRTSAIEERDRAHRHATRNKFMNLRALAISRNPELLNRPTGKLHWQGDTSVDDMKTLSHVGDNNALLAYIEANRGSLEAEASAIRKKALDVLADDGAGTFPMHNAEWSAWLEEHDEEFRHHLKHATRERRDLGKRLRAPDDLPAAPRIQAEQHGELPTWCKVLAQQDSGVFCLVCGESIKVVFFASALWGRPWIIRLRWAEPSIFSFEIAQSFHVHFRPAQEVLESLGVRVPDEAWSLHKLDATVRGINWPEQTHLQIQINKMSPPLEKTVHTRAQAEEKDNNDDLCSVASSDACSLCSDVESAAEEELEEDLGAEAEAEAEAEEGDADETQTELQRKAHGTHTVSTNGYFTYTKDPAYTDVKVKVLPRWCKIEELGTTQMSKTVTIKHYDDDEENPILSLLVLRAWMIHRFQVRGFANAKPSRQSLLQRWVHELRVDIINLGIEGGGTGSDAANTKIREWAPQALIIEG